MSTLECVESKHACVCVFWGQGEAAEVAGCGMSQLQNCQLADLLACFVPCMFPALLVPGACDAYVVLLV